MLDHGIYESADWKEVTKARPQLAAHLAIEAFRVLNKKGSWRGEERPSALDYPDYAIDLLLPGKCRVQSRSI